MAASVVDHGIVRESCPFFCVDFGSYAVAQDVEFEIRRFTNGDQAALHRCEPDRDTRDIFVADADADCGARVDRSEGSRRAESGIDMGNRIVMQRSMTKPMTAFQNASKVQGKASRNISMMAAAAQDPPSRPRIRAMTRPIQLRRFTTRIMTRRERSRSPSTIVCGRCAVMMWFTGRRVAGVLSFAQHA
jgi:hypothetical protein